MAITAFDGPVVGGFDGAPLPGMPANQNPQKGPSTFKDGHSVMDPRLQWTYLPGQDMAKPVYGTLDAFQYTIDQVPTTATANNIAAAQTATAGTAMTLAAANTTGVTVASSITNGSTGATVTGLLALDTAMTGVQFGSSGTMRIWDPAKAVSRNVVITCNGTDTGTYTVSGYDVYGFQLSETITGTTGTASAPKTAPGKKAFKYITSVTPAGTMNSTGATVGTGDVFGLPIRADRAQQTMIYWGNPAVLQEGNSTGSSQTITIGPLTLSTLVSTAVLQVAVPFDGVVTADAIRTIVSAANATGAFSLTIGGTTAGVTGGVVSFASAGSGQVAGAIQTGTAITAGNTFTAGQTIGVTITAGVNAAWTAGVAVVEFTVVNTDIGGNGTFTAAVTTTPATTTTGDTRGTYAVPLASDGTRRLVAFQAISPSNIGTATGIYGVNQNLA